MNRKCFIYATVVLLLGMMAAPLAYAEEDLDEILRDADTLLYKTGDSSATERLLAVALQRNPNDVTAKWRLLQIRRSELGFDSSATLLEMNEALLADGPALAEIVKLAQQQGKQAFVHYAMADYAQRYHDFERALAEIDAAIQIKPQSVFYQYVKAVILADKGRFEDDEDALLSGIAILEQQLQALLQNPKLKMPFSLEDYYFKLAWHYSHLPHGQPEKVVDYYQQAIAHHQGDPSNLAFAWNNLALAYNYLGKCADAQQATNNALQIFEFGAARHTLSTAKLCEELQNLDLGE